MSTSRYKSRFVRILMALALILLVPLADRSPAYGSPEVTQCAPEAWIEEVPVPSISDVPVDEIQDGQYYLLLDRQVQVGEDDAVRYYSHYAIQVVSASGMEPSSQISISFDPEYQRLRFHKLVIRRGTEIIDKLPATEIELFRRETELESLIYDGRYTADTILDDVRVGDVIEYAYTIEGDNPLFDGVFSYYIDTDWDVPVLKHRFVLRWPRSRPLFHKNFLTDEALTETTRGDWTVYSFLQENIHASRHNSETPLWYDPYGFIQVSESGTWGEIVSWALPLYRVAYIDDGGIREIVDGLSSADATDEENVMGALSYVQNEIRYLGIEFGANSHKPSLPGETFQRRYGDCKDKTVALVSLLTALGIEAYPALVNSYLQHTIEGYLPTIHAFDHVIACATVNGREYWLDPTIQHQGNKLEKVYQPDYGMALVIRPGETGLTGVPSNDDGVGVVFEETFDLRGEPTEAVSYRVDALYRGLDAEEVRYWLAEDGRKALEEDYLNFYASYYEKIAADGSARVTDNPDENELSLYEQYRIHDFWEADEEERWCTFYSNAIYSYLNKPAQRQRHEPFEIQHPVNVRQAIHVLLSDTWDIQEGSFSERNPFFNYSSRISFNNITSTATLEYQFRSLTDSVAPEELEEYMAALDRVEDDLDYSLSESLTVADSAVPGVRLLYWARTHFLLVVVVVWLVVLAYCLAEWRLEYRRSGGLAGGYYFPVSLPRLFALSIATFGLYQLYWFYQGWKYIRNRDGSMIMPFWRAVFTPIWFLPFYLELRRDSISRFGKPLLPSLPWGILLWVLFLGLNIISVFDGVRGWVSLLDVVCLLPFANYILHINREHSETIRQLSTWRFRHYLVSAFAALLIMYNMAGLLNWIPAGEVITGEQLPGWEIKFLHRKGILPGDARLLYFYSDALFFNRNEGSGVTDRNVFSYWIDGGGLQLRSAAYDDIEDIRVRFSDTEAAISVVTVIPKNGPSFILYASGEREKDRLFVAAIRERLFECSPESD
jgi:transglutaminase-like putative cysteine protease